MVFGVFLFPEQPLSAKPVYHPARRRRGDHERVGKLRDRGPVTMLHHLQQVELRPGNIVLLELASEDSARPAHDRTDEEEELLGELGALVNSHSSSRNIISMAN